MHERVSALFQQLREPRHRLPETAVERRKIKHARVGVDGAQLLLEPGRPVGKKIGAEETSVRVAVIVERAGGDAAERGVAYDLCRADAPVCGASRRKGAHQRKTEGRSCATVSG